MELKLTSFVLGPILSLQLSLDLTLHAAQAKLGHIINLLEQTPSGRIWVRVVLVVIFVTARK